MLHLGRMGDTSGPAVASAILRELDRTSRSGGWWNTGTAAVLVDLARSGPFVVALAGIAEVLREGEDPEWAVGDVTAAAAFGVAQEWLDAGVEPTEVAGWLRAGCWNPKIARQMEVVGLSPSRLLDDEGRPVHWVEATNGERMSVALAVANDLMAVADVVRVVARS